MKSAVKAVAVFALFGAVLAHAQPSPGQFQHVIIVVQENRTPDNLFGGVPGANGLPPFMPGVDLAQAPGAEQWCLGACFDPAHENNAWQQQHTSGVPGYIKNPGGCGPSTKYPTRVTYCSSPPGDPVIPESVCNSHTGNNWPGCSPQPPTTPINLPAWPEESYVSYTYEQIYTQNGAQHVLDPYISIATQYGFANYFYQTNQGPSQPAHDFLFGGTSAPIGDPTQPYYNWFAADNPKGSGSSGCEAPSGQTVALINPDGFLYDKYYPPYKEVDQSPCFDHNTLSDLLEHNGLTWQYYSNDPGNIWTAPNGISHICLTSGSSPGQPCNNSDFTNNVKPTKSFFADFGSGGTNLAAPQTYCSLPSVAWIVPDGAFSDHPGLSGGDIYSTAKEGGPNWVASIVNAVGNAQCVEQSNGKSPWYDTVIFVVWDDWGGWYDHVMEFGPNGQKIGVPYEDNYLVQGVNPNPPTCIPSYTYNGTQYWGCGYTYGFRVPFLVVSAYTQNVISGKCTMGADCYPPNGNGNANVAPYQHDFGSILAFIEYNFSLGIGCINNATDVTGTVQCKNRTPGNVPFADYFAPEVVAGSSVPLREFFNVNPQGPLGPTTIPFVNNSFTLDYFKNFNGPFTDPDNDVIDND